MKFLCVLIDGSKQLHKKEMGLHGEGSNGTGIVQLMKFNASDLFVSTFGIRVAKSDSSVEDQLL